VCSRVSAQEKPENDVVQHTGGSQLIHLMLVTKPRTDTWQNKEGKRQQQYLSAKQSKHVSVFSYLPDN